MMLNERKIQLKIKKIKSVIADILLRQNICRGHFDYTKFIILCRSRTGSNLLINLLESHSKMRLFYELFSNNHKPNKFWDFVNQDSQTVWEMKQNNPADFLDKLVFREMPEYISAVGFKIFYYHAQKGRERSVWNYLKDTKDIKILHLKRKNILKTYLSQETAFKTNNWVSKNKYEKINQPSINLNYNSVLKAFQKTRQREQEAEK